MKITRQELKAIEVALIRKQLSLARFLLTALIDKADE